MTFDYFNGYSMTEHDKEILAKIANVMEKHHTFSAAITKGDAVSYLVLANEEFLQHMSDLADLVESPDLKADIEMELATARVGLEEMAVMAEALMKYRNERSRDFPKD